MKAIHMKQRKVLALLLGLLFVFSTVTIVLYALAKPIQMNERNHAVKKLLSSYLEADDASQFTVSIGGIGPPIETQMSKNAPPLSALTQILLDRENLAVVEMGKNKIASDRRIKIALASGNLQVFFYDFGIMEIVGGRAFRVPRKRYEKLLEEFNETTKF